MSMVTPSFEAVRFGKRGLKVWEEVSPCHKMSVSFLYNHQKKVFWVF